MTETRSKTTLDKTDMEIRQLKDMPDFTFRVFCPSPEITVAFTENTPYTPKQYDKAMTLLPFEYKARVENYYDERYRFQSALCYAMLKTLSGGNVEMEFTRNGKPYDSGDKIFFNFSHAGETSVCAVADREIGTDACEYLSYCEESAKIFCTLSERKRLASAKDPDTLLTEFFTRKESYIKLKGGSLRSIKNAPDDRPVKYVTAALNENTLCTICTYSV